MLNSVYRFFLKLIKPFVIWMGKIHMPWSVKEITGDHYYRYRDQIKSGSILLATTRGFLSNLFNPSGIEHGAMYVGGDDIKYITEALGNGVQKNNLVGFMLTKDIIVHVRPKFGNAAQHKKVCEEMNKLIGSGYDFEFESGDKEYYCFEAIIHAYKQIFPDKEFKKVEIVKGKFIYDSTTFTDDPDLWEIIVDSRKE